MRRYALFAVVILGVLVQVFIVANAFGLDRYLSAAGLPLGGLLAIVAGVAIVGAVVSLARSVRMAKRLVSAREIGQTTSPSERWLLTTVHRQARAVGIGAPTVAVFDSPEVNSFAIGVSRDRALLAVSSGLLKLLSEDEAEAVIAHEIAHVANGDMVTLGLLQGVRNTLVNAPCEAFRHLIDRSICRNGGDEGPAYLVAYIFMQFSVGALASLILSWFSRRREYRADRDGAELSGHTKMIAALKRLDAVCAPLPLPARLRAFGVSGPSSAGALGLSSTHPPLVDRIAALSSERRQGIAGGQRHKTEWC